MRPIDILNPWYCWHSVSTAKQKPFIPRFLFLADAQSSGLWWIDYGGTKTTIVRSMARLQCCHQWWWYQHQICSVRWPLLGNQSRTGFHCSCWQKFSRKTLFILLFLPYRRARKPPTTMAPTRHDNQPHRRSQHNHRERARIWLNPDYNERRVIPSISISSTLSLDSYVPVNDRKTGTFEYRS